MEDVRRECGEINKVKKQRGEYDTSLSLIFGVE